MIRSKMIVCLAVLALPLCNACNSNGSNIIKTAIREREKKKGNQLISVSVNDELAIPNNGTVAHYNARCIKHGQDPSQAFTVKDSVIVFKTGDGIYTTN